MGLVHSARVHSACPTAVQALAKQAELSKSWKLSFPLALSCFPVVRENHDSMTIWDNEPHPARVTLGCQPRVAQQIQPLGQACRPRLNVWSCGCYYTHPDGVTAPRRPSRKRQALVHTLARLFQIISADPVSLGRMLRAEATDRSLRENLQRSNLEPTLP